MLQLQVTVYAQLHPAKLNGHALGCTPNLSWLCISTPTPYVPESYTADAVKFHRLRRRTLRSENVLTHGHFRRTSKAANLQLSHQRLEGFGVGVSITTLTLHRRPPRGNSTSNRTDTKREHVVGTYRKPTNQKRRRGLLTLVYGNPQNTADLARVDDDTHEGEDDDESDQGDLVSGISAMQSISMNAPIGRADTPTHVRAGNVSRVKNCSYISFMGRKSRAMWTRYMVTLTACCMPDPDAARILEMFSRAARVCAWMPPSTIR